MKCVHPFAQRWQLSFKCKPNWKIVCLQSQDQSLFVALLLIVEVCSVCRLYIQANTNCTILHCIAFMIPPRFFPVQYFLLYSQTPDDDKSLVASSVCGWFEERVWPVTQIIASFYLRLMTWDMRPYSASSATVQIKVTPPAYSNLRDETQVILCWGINI